MNNQAIKEEENKNSLSAMETRVDTVDYRSSTGQSLEQRSVQVIHQPHSSGNSTTGGGVLASAAAAVASTVQSAKDIYSGK
ncbi:hypothetical protein I3760_01G012100 [Carya illinoinensis]|uniref:Uncharacterized protein n=1 Tax=Carya illinoinensis TaxID=32201 RepID=A0A8T1RHS5_CARIL|nr:hypothetical protein I3760_01G012100 [Carya illinoinensis]KAG6666175.1 hypothetical protein CIPAW_01G013300 [Carya illinoinensis]KAG6729142.1 hypothetical protein I3842_01G012200 [Carya illinoinensis]